ncbi:hypothetical protein DFQ28_003002 [Apophysomyces sp. BC1034]|nr:hypothetical protein DFQ29_005699 [Apophysomyces sp. BC1021]KAG0193850.1 hypothetical protein DFQ28_003002 [Apophysomyces sp. BC1034]
MGEAVRRPGGLSRSMEQAEILTVDAYDFIKPKSISRFLTPVLGEGLIIAEGSTHRNQRKILNPAFSVQALRGLAPIMAKPAWALRRQWLQAMDSDPSGAPAVNVSAKLNLVTLDIIGLAAFGEDFCLVEDAQSNRLGQAYLDVCLGDKLIHRVLGVLFPLYRKLPFRAIRIVERGIVSLDEETRAIVLNNLGKTNGDNLLRRMAREIDPETGESLSVKELQAQCLTFMAAGHETAGTALSWCLWFLARHKDIQTALRTEVRSLSLDDDEVPSYDAINRLNLLNNVCREALRLIPPVPITYRVARKDTILGGHVVSKDSFIAVSPLVSHLSPEFWGEDADRFRPSRWDEAPANNVSPYVYMPFLAGPRQCIGSKFAMMEMKMVLCIVLKDLLFSEKPNFHPQKKHVLVTRPSPNMTLVVQRA